MPEWMGVIVVLAVIFGIGYVVVSVREHISERAQEERERRERRRHGG